jgi:hypothetical protein
MLVSLKERCSSILSSSYSCNILKIVVKFLQRSTNKYPNNQVHFIGGILRRTGKQATVDYTIFEFHIILSIIGERYQP